METNMATTTDDIKCVPVGDVPKEMLIHVDATPDDGYVLRILRAHLARQRGYRMEVRGGNKGLHQLADFLNEAAEKRATLLEKAIAKLTKASP
jgi:hypothetical protein